MIICETIKDIFAPGEEGVTLVQTSEATRDPMVVSQALAHLTGLPCADLVPTVRKRHGPIILQNLRPDIAQELASALDTLGVCSSLCPAAKMVVPQLLGNVEHFDYDARGLHINPLAQDKVMPWTAVALIAVAFVEVDKHQSDARFAAGPSAHSLEAEPASGFKPRGTSLEKALIADIFLASEEGVSYARLWARHLPYAKLLNVLKPSSMENFRAVLQEICELSPDYIKNSLCEDLLAGKLLSPAAALHSLEAFDEENLKLLKLPW